MPTQRNVFRIEELDRVHPAPLDAEAESALRHNEIMTELQFVRALLAAREPPVAQQQPDVEDFKRELTTIYDAVSRTKHELAALLVTGFASPAMGRVTHELKAVVGTTESATHEILEAGEEIEEIAKNLSAAIKNIQDRDLARDILDQVTRIFEACNFQDLAGQRIDKVSTTLKFIEDHILRLMEIWGGIEKLEEALPEAQAERNSHPQLVNGPRLDGDRGHVSQKDIDKMFAPDAD
jgi:chemotaxis protein CheZ